MNLFDEMPDIPKCPHCGHDGEGLEWAFPDSGFVDNLPTKVQCACLSCGAHGPVKGNYVDAIKAFATGETDKADDLATIYTDGKKS